MAPGPSRGQRQRPQLVLGDRRARPPAGRAPCRRPARRRSPSPAPAAPGRRPASRPWPPTPVWPSRSQPSSAVYGANSDSMTASASAASRTAGSAAPGPESIALRVALTQLHQPGHRDVEAVRLDQPGDLVDRAVGDLAQREVTAVEVDAGRGCATSAMHAEGAGQELLRRRPATRRPSRCRPRAGRRTPSSAGPRRRRTRRSARPGRRRCPATWTSPCRWLITWPWLSSRGERLGEVDHAHVVQHLGEEPAYSRCRIACSTPPTYWSTGTHLRTCSTSNGPSV